MSNDKNNTPHNRNIKEAIKERLSQLQQSSNNEIPSVNNIEVQEKLTDLKIKIEESEHKRKRENRLTSFIMLLIGIYFAASLLFNVALPIMYINEQISRESIEFLVEHFSIFNWGTVIATFIPLVINFVKQKFDIKIYSKDDSKK